MKKRICLAMRLLMVVTILTSVETFASSDFFMLTFVEKGVDSLKIPSDMSIVTRDSYYNIATLSNHEEIRSNMAGSNTYVCALPSSRSYEIDIDFIEYDTDISIEDFKNLSIDELMEVLSTDITASISDLEASFVKVGTNYAIEVSAYLKELNQYLFGYMFTTKGSVK